MEPQQGTVLIGVVLVAVDLAIRIAALNVIPRERKPTATMARLLAILLVPYGVVHLNQAALGAVPAMGGSRADLVEALHREASRELTPVEWEKEPLRATGPDRFARLTSVLE